MRILALAPVWPWPARQGVAIRASKILEALSSRYHVGAIGFSTGGPTQIPDFLEQTVIMPAPAWHVAKRLLWMLQAKPDLAGRRWGPSILQAVRRVVREWHPDIVLVFGLEMAPLVPTGVSDTAPLIVYDAQNCESSLQRSAMLADARSVRRWHRVIYSWVQWRLLRGFERTWLRRVAAAVAVSDEDRRRLSNISGRDDIVVVPNGVDCDYYNPSHCDHQPGKPRLLFTGQMDFRPNVDAVEWFVDAVLPHLMKESADLQFFVVGRSPAPSVRSSIGRGPVVVTGEVEDTRPYLCSADCFVAPLRMGGGTRLKVLEAAAMEVPLVATSLAVEGTSLLPGEHFVKAEDAQAFVNGVLWVLENRVEARRMAQRARQLVEKLYRWPVVSSQYFPVLEAVIG